MNTPTPANDTLPTLTPAQDERRIRLYMQTEDACYETLAVAEAACLLVKAGFPTGRATLAAATLHRLGKTLHRAFERSCNEGDFDDRPTVRRIRADIECLDLLTVYDLHRGCMRPSNVTLVIQSDPRGWPIVLSFDGSESRLGGGG